MTDLRLTARPHRRLAGLILPLALFAALANCGLVPPGADTQGNVSDRGESDSSDSSRSGGY